MSDKIDLIYDIIKSEKEESAEFRKEVRDANRRVDEKLAKIEIETSERLSKIEVLDHIQNQQLSEHMRRTDLLEGLHKDNEKRIKTLEIPATTLATLGKWTAWIVAASGAVMAIMKLIGMI